MIKVTIPATDRAILTIDELRAAAGVTGNSEDERLDQLGVDMADTLARLCRISEDGVHPPTFKVETIEETLRCASSQDGIILSRFPVRSITSVEISGEAVLTDEYEVNPSTGILNRIYGDVVSLWAPGKIRIVYVSGLDPIPGDLRSLISDMVGYKWAASQASAGGGSRIKRKEIVDISVTDYWVDSAQVDKASKTGFPADIESRILARQNQLVR